MYRTLFQLPQLRHVRRGSARRRKGRRPQVPMRSSSCLGGAELHGAILRPEQTQARNLRLGTEQPTARTPIARSHPTPGSLRGQERRVPMTPFSHDNTPISRRPNAAETQHGQGAEGGSKDEMAESAFSNGAHSLFAAGPGLKHQRGAEGVQQRDQRIWWNPKLADLTRPTRKRYKKRGTVTLPTWA